VFVAYCLVSTVRIALDLALSSGTDLYRSYPHDRLAILTYQMLFVALTFSLFVMVNRRLIAGLESDISSRRRADAIIRLRLSLWEFAANHSVAALMQRALDEIEELTGSLVGFYHFVQEDQNTLSLEAWSTRTLAEFCKAEGRGLHYPIAEAGVWVDCVRERKPVIHNDYSALPHRKGMPDGHARVVRELVVPTFRQGRVVSILGVGNKASDYDQRDVEVVGYIADVVWVIVERRQVDEEILRLNTQLERMAMTDELTSLRNRRFFFAQGAEEIRRSLRYQMPLSAIMLDIDGFKSVNDAHGHSTETRFSSALPGRCSPASGRSTWRRVLVGRSLASCCRTRRARTR